MKLLIAGAAGQLGQALLREAAARNWEAVGADLPQMDITDPRAIRQQLARHRPQVVVNAAAATRVDDLEQDADLALQVNGLGPRNLAVACRQLGCKLIHLSSDYVFDGAQDRPYLEWDATRPPVGLWPEQAPGGGTGAAAVPRSFHRAHRLALRPAGSQLRHRHPGERQEFAAGDRS